MLKQLSHKGFLDVLFIRYGVLPESLQPGVKKGEDENENQLMEEVAR